MIIFNVKCSTLHSVEILVFFYHPDFPQNQFWRFQDFKNYQFCRFRSFVNLVTFKIAKIQSLKWQYMELLISRKIWWQKNSEISKLWIKHSSALNRYISWNWNQIFTHNFCKIHCHLWKFQDFTIIYYYFTWIQFCGL